MLRLPSLKGTLSAKAYVVLGPILLLAQHGLVAAVYRVNGLGLHADTSFWLLPLRRLATMPGLTAIEASVAFIISLCLMWALAIVSFRRATASGYGYALAALAMVPTIQIAAVATLIFLPRRQPPPSPENEASDASNILRGVLMGAAIIVFAVLISAVTFGAYGWGLFVLTPFIVGATTAYVANRRVPLDSAATIALALTAAGLGSFMLLMLALEGFVCILLIAPLAAVLAIFGAVIGRSVAMVHHRGNPTLSIALLPAIFALDAALPPDLPIVARETIEIAAPSHEVWKALTGDRPIEVPPGLVGRAGLAFPLRSRIVEPRVGGERHGHFSTGLARERITAWSPGQVLAVRVIDQPPAMEEMSPYRRVHAPHVEGYFDTEEMRFTLKPLADGRTRLEIEARHVLRIDPVLYWEPIAQWAIRSNIRRVLNDLKAKAERLTDA